MNSTQTLLELFEARLPYLEGPLTPERRLDTLAVDSLDLMELLLVIDEVCHVRLTQKDLAAVTTVGELTKLVQAREIL